MFQNATIWFCIFANCGQFTIAQNIAERETSRKLADDTSKFLIRWAQRTVGFGLSKGEQILYTNESVIVVGKNDVPSWVLATYDFSPAMLSANLQIHLNRVQSLIINDVGTNASATFNSIPAWVTHFTGLRSLSLQNADLSDLSICRGFPICYLDLRNVKYNDTSSLVETIFGFRDLELFIYDDSISEEVISTLSEGLPNTKFINKAK